MYQSCFSIFHKLLFAWMWDILLQSILLLNFELQSYAFIPWILEFHMSVQNTDEWNWFTWKRHPRPKKSEAEGRPFYSSLGEHSWASDLGCRHYQQSSARCRQGSKQTGCSYCAKQKGAKQYVNVKPPWLSHPLSFRYLPIEHFCYPYPIWSFVSISSLFDMPSVKCSFSLFDWVWPKTHW